MRCWNKEVETEEPRRLGLCCNPSPEACSTGLVITHPHRVVVTARLPDGYNEFHSNDLREDLLVSLTPCWRVVRLQDAQENLIIGLVQL